MSETLLVLALLINLRILSSNRLASCVDWVALQGALLSIYPFFAHAEHIDLELVGLGVSSLLLKGFYFPRVLHHAMRNSQAKRETAPLVGHISSLLIGLGALVVCHWIGLRLPLLDPEISRLTLPVALFCVFCGLFLITARRMVVMQAVGYLVLDSGIFAVGISVFPQASLLVELGLLLNLCVAVVVRGIIIYNLSRVFHHMDSHRLSTLKG